MANAPSQEGGMAETYHNFRFSESNIFQARTGNPNQHDSTHEIGFLAQAIWRCREPDERDESVRIDQTDLPVVGQISWSASTPLR
jgi:hypothetical protein